MRPFTLFCGVSLLLLPAIAKAEDPPIVYARCARTTAELDVTGTVVVGGVSKIATRRMRGLDVYDVLPDVVNFYRGFSAPCDLMLRAPDGTERVLHDCSSTSTPTEACAALDPSVSFDGKTIAYAVFRGPLTTLSDHVHAKVIDPSAENSDVFSTKYPNKMLDAKESGIHLVDVSSGKITVLPHTSGVFDSGPTWLPNGRIAFTSTRDGTFSTVVPSTFSSEIASQIWTMDPDGRNADLASHHGLGREEHPFVLADGRVAYSSWQIFGGLPFRHTNGTVGGFTTIGNLFHLFVQNPDGAHQFALYGQHSGLASVTTSIGAAHDAAHFLTQTSDGRVYFADYYRGNNSGLGIVVGIKPEPEGQEGFAPVMETPFADVYAPRSAINVAKWATNSDNFASLMPLPSVKVSQYQDPLPFAGKLGHPGALPNNGLMVTWGKGPCGTVADSAVFAALGSPTPPLTHGHGVGTAMNVVTSINRDTPGCDAGIYRLSKIPSAHPGDLDVIVDHREWHEIQARAVVPYSAIHGVEKPKVIPSASAAVSRADLPSGTPFGLLGAASIIDRETHPRAGIHFAGEHQFNLQGTDTIDYSDDALCGVRILAVLPNRGKDTNEVVKDLNDLSGERVTILGEFAVRNLDETGKARKDPNGNPDTSFLVRFPADIPYLMQGIDCDGRTLNTDQTWQSLRPGEMKTCGGCHVHSRPSVLSFDKSWAAKPEYKPIRLGEGEVPFLAGRAGSTPTVRTVKGYSWQIEFERDISPIFQRRCNSCHSGSSPAGNLALDRPGVDPASGGAAPSTWWCLVRDVAQTCVPSGQRFLTNAQSAGDTRLRRPQVSRYVRAFNALGSLLYWKAAGKRTDGRTDSTFTNASPVEDRDIDFGAAHSTSMTSEELGILSRWIDIGSPGGSGELKDTAKPTINLSALAEGASVTKLFVGAVDVPSGIDAASLEVCILDEAGKCGPNLAPGGTSNDSVVTIPMGTPLSNPDTVVRARVRDLAGNETVVDRTVRWLLNLPPPPPPGSSEPGAGADAGTGRESGGDGGDEASACACRIPTSSTGRGALAAWLGVAALAALVGRSRRR